ncbi:AEC family transporter [soil metagenome]
MSAIQNLVALFSGVCLPIVVVAGAGWAIDRKFRLDLDSLVKLNLYLLVPAFIFVRVYSSDLAGPTAMRVVAFTLVMIAVMFGASLLAARLVGASRAERKAMNLATMFYNCGNYGIPLVTLAFGEFGQSIQVYVLLTMNVSTFSVGLLLAAGEGAPWEGGGHRLRRWLPVLRQPSIHAIVLALVLRQFPFDLTAIPFLWQPAEMVASALVAFALVTLGVQLSHTSPPAIRGRLGWALGIRLLVAPAVAAPLALFVFGFGPEIAPVLIAGTAVPTAVNTALIAHEFNADTRFAVAAVFYSTVFSLVSVTVVLALVT